jgi:hypothetical protein
MTEQNDGATRLCIDCGVNPTTGLRCRTCYGRYKARQVLDETADRDRELLDMVDRERLSGQRLADRLGVSRVAATNRVREARRRGAERQAVTT